MLEILGYAATAAVTVWGYVQARRFVRTKLRYVDGVQNPAVPVVAGFAGALVAAPVVWLLPVVGGLSAVLFGAGIGFGVHRGARDVKRLPGF